MCSASPVYCVNRFAWKFYPNRNKTIIGLVYTEDRESVEKVSFAINNVFIPFSSFVTVLICTIVLVVKLQRKTKWRQKVTTTDNFDTAAKRDQKVAKMVVTISTLFISCFIPVCIIFLAMTLTPEFSIDGKYKNIFIVVFGLSFILESTNSAVNIFIYYRMSSKYRTVFRKLFGFDKEE